MITRSGRNGRRGNLTGIKMVIARKEGKWKPENLLKNWEER